MPRFCVESSTTVRSLLFCTRALFMNYVTITFLLVNSPVSSKQLNLVFCARSRSKKRTRTYNKEPCWVYLSFPSINYAAQYYDLKNFIFNQHQNSFIIVPGSEFVFRIVVFYSFDNPDFCIFFVFIHCRKKRMKKQRGSVTSSISDFLRLTLILKPV